MSNVPSPLGREGRVTKLYSLESRIVLHELTLQPSDSPMTTVTSEPLCPSPTARRWSRLPLLPLLLLAVAGLWAYWPTILELIRAWDRSPDYSHGYLVVPVALYFLWHRRHEYPGRPVRPGGIGWADLGLGLLLLAASLGLRYLGARYRLGSVDAWSMILWLAGVVAILGGWRVFWWSVPSLCFLWFMVPLPWRAERMFSLPLQGIATRLSTWTLQSLGQPAFAQGHVIFLGPHELEVAQACSGLRVLVATVALAFAYCVLIRKSWWKRIAIAVSTIPVALAANASRIVATGLLYQVASAETGKQFEHDMAGWFMIPLAALLFAAVLWYLDRLFPEMEEVEIADLFVSPRKETEVRQQEPRGSRPIGSDYAQES